MHDRSWEEEEEETTQECERCCGSGEVGPFGWEYPEYETCPDCNGEGVENNYCEADEAYQRKKDASL